MRLGHRVVRDAHVEEDAAILQKRRRGMAREVVLNLLSKLASGWRHLPGTCGTAYQPMRARRPVMWAVWWSECHA